ncbi:MAG TPA: beta-N-acetylhexosaminidase [Vicinamibacteria bacterium]|nr:beta-N-acetylhexosaminidase [Vicinamibacteria bacterium]
MRDSVRKVGECTMIGFDGHAVPADVKRLIRDYGVGQVILFRRNVASPEQVADLVRELQSVAREARLELPILVAVDQEGGRVARLREPWTLWPTARALGRTGDEQLARQMGEALANELSACGIRLDFTPVMDVDTNPANPVIGDRSFGSDPQLVGRMGVAVIHGLQDAGVAACAKHFPGHGDTDLDSHFALPAVDHSRSRLEEIELPPFRKAIEAGVASFMTAHVIVRELDDTVPATLSPRIVQGLLRDELRFEGVIFTDDMEMKAVSERWGYAAAAVMAMNAGCDALPVCASHDAQVTAMEALIRAVEGGQLPWARLDDAYMRVRRLKHRFVLPYPPPDPRQARQAAGAGEWSAVAQAISTRGGADA